MLPNRDLTKHPACNWIPTGAKATCVYGVYSACLILEYLLSSTSLSYLSPSCCSSQVWCEGNWLPPPPSPKALEELSFSASPLQSLQREALPNKATGGCIIQQRDSLRYEKKAAARGGAFFFLLWNCGIRRNGSFQSTWPVGLRSLWSGRSPPTVLTKTQRRV